MLKSKVHHRPSDGANIEAILRLDKNDVGEFGDSCCREHTQIYLHNPSLCLVLAWLKSITALPAQRLFTLYFESSPRSLLRSLPHQCLIHRQALGGIQLIRFAAIAVARSV